MASKHPNSSRACRTRVFVDSQLLVCCLRPEKSMIGSFIVSDPILISFILNLRGSLFLFSVSFFESLWVYL